MRRLVIFALVATTLANVESQASNLLERAEAEIAKDLYSRTLNGATSPRFNRKKVTAMSKAMSRRNALFSKSMALLEADGVEKSEARELVRQALKERQGRRRRGAGGQSGQTDEIELADDMCEDAEIECPTSNFRTIDGRCNNVGSGKELWGSMSIPLRRYLDSITNIYTLPTYLSTDDTAATEAADGATIDGTYVQTRQGSKNKNKNNNNNNNNNGGSETENLALEAVKRFGVTEQFCSCSSGCVEDATVALPNARLVSALFHDDDVNAESTEVTHMVTQWGQFLDHDIVLTPEEEAHDCCHDDSDQYCMQISVPSDDYFYGEHGITCLEFSRSVGFCEEDIAIDSAEHNQLNAITAYVDASNVYGSSEAERDTLRALDGTGKLAVDEYNLLPFLGADERKAGDVRAREMPGLATMHTLWVREHNRLCDALTNHKDVTSDWTDDDYFENARRILIAEMQKVVYGEYLPVVMGDDGMKEWDLELSRDSKYDSNADPSISNSFATAAYRFGHSMIQGLIEMYTEASNTAASSYELGQNYFDMTNYEANSGDGMEQILTGLCKQAAQGMDRHCTVEVTNKLFANVGETPGVGGDLVSRNIQRGRDHGLPSYTAFYREFGPSDQDAMDCWDYRPSQITSENWNILKTIYQHPHHIDLFVGGLAEKPYKDGLTGATFQGIKGRQFKDLKDGDRWFFTHEGNMDRNEYNEIMDRTLADIICDNTAMSKIPENVFLVGSKDKNCPSSSSLNIDDFNVYRA